MNRKTLLSIAVFAVVLVGAALYFQSVPKNTQSTANTSVAETSDWKTYINKEYGFQLTLTGAWKGYRVRKEINPNGITILEFEVPIKDKEYGMGTGFAPPFLMAVYAKNQWGMVPKEGEPGGSDRMSKSDIYIFTFSGGWTDSPPEELKDVDFHIADLMTSFKLLP